LEVVISGQSGHAGTVPMSSRKDPLMGVSEILNSIEKICFESLGTLGTVGKMEIEPGGINVIPDTVSFTVDLRDLDDKRRAQTAGLITDNIERICKRRKLSHKVHSSVYAKSTKCSNSLIKLL